MSPLYSIFIPFFISLFLVGWIHPRLVKIAILKNIVDNPDARKLQRTPVPVLGGVAIFFGIVIGIGSVGGVVNSSGLLIVIMAMMAMLYTGNDGRYPEPFPGPAISDRNTRRTVIDPCRRLLHRRFPWIMGHRPNSPMDSRSADRHRFRGDHQRHQSDRRRERTLFGILHPGLYNVRHVVLPVGVYENDASGRGVGRGIDPVLFPQCLRENIADVHR